MNIVLPDEAGYRAAVEALKAGEVVGYPTETVYGLGVDPLSDRALDALYRVKQRDPRNPVLIVIGSIAQLDPLVDNIPASARRCIDAFWPGPLSLLFPRNPNLSKRLANEQDRICVRWSSHLVAARLANDFGGGITSTSANKTGNAPAQRADQVPREGVALCIDGGTCSTVLVSTVYDSERDLILREGAISRAQLDAVLGNS